MASWLGRYVEEFGQVRESVLLSVYFVSASNGKINTSFETDLLYLPKTFTDVATPKAVKNYCNLTVNPRRAKLWVNNDTFLSAPVPFRAFSSGYNAFFLECKANTKITSIGLIGEKVKSDWIKFYVGT